MAWDETLWNDLESSATTPPPDHKNSNQIAESKEAAATMPPKSEQGTIAPEADVDLEKNDGDDNAPPTTDDDFDSSVKAVNKYTPGNEIDADAKKGGIDVAVTPLPEDNGTAAASSSKQQASHHPPSLFTNERGNLKAVSFVVRNPCLVFSLIIALCILINFLLVVLVFRTTEGSPFTISENESDLNDERSIVFDSYRLATREVSATREAMEAEGSALAKKQSELAAIAYWVFEAEEGNDAGLFGSAAAIEGMKDAYDIFTDDPGFRDYCYLDYQKNATDPPCRPPLTPLTMYYASEWDDAKAASIIEELKDPAKVEKFNSLALCFVKELYCDPELQTTIKPEDIAWAMQLGADIESMTSKFDMEGPLVQNYQQVTELASYLMKVDIAKGAVDFGYDKGFSAENPKSSYSRGIVFWGGPLQDRNQSTAVDSDEKDEVEDSEGDDRKEYILENYLEAMDYQADKKTHGTVNSYYFMTSIIGDVILNIVTKDAMLALFSFAFIFIWLRVNTLSWFLAFVGLFEIFFSIPIAWFIFTVIFRIKYFATLNALAIFVVAAIGADDIFIFMDAYKQSQYHPDVLVDLETRMSWVYRRTGTAMAITSATTCAAFLCTLLTPLTAIQSFGIFAAVVILIDYVLVMSLFCTAVVIYHNRYENSAKLGCCCPCGLVSPSNTEQARVFLEGHEGEITRDRVSEFFRTKVAGFVKIPLHRLVVGVIFLVWLSIAIWQMSMIEATKESEQFLDSENPLQKSLTILDREFPTADDDLGLKVHFVWGVDRVDRSGVNLLLDPEFFGNPRFTDFNFNQQCQSDLLDFCDKLKTDNQYKGLIKRKNGVGQVYCFIEELAAFNVNGNLDDCESVRKGEWRTANGTNANVTWQVDPDELPNIIPEFLKAKTCFDESGVETISGRYQKEIGWNGLYMKYAGVAAESDVLDPFGLDAEAVTRAEYDQFIDISEEQDKISQSCGGAVIMTDLDSKFVFMNNQAIYVRSAIQSSLLGVAIAFVVLIISTRVFHRECFPNPNFL